MNFASLKAKANAESHTRTLNAVQVCQVHYSLKSFYFNIVPQIRFLDLVHVTN